MFPQFQRIGGFHIHGENNTRAAADATALVENLEVDVCSIQYHA